MEIVESYNVKIWVGLKNMENGRTKKIKDVEKMLQNYVNTFSSDCYSLTETKFIYTGGCEKGLVIGLINYPRFERTNDHILQNAIDIGTMLMYKLNQYRVTITTPTKTYMLKNETNEIRR
tara:strand:+ start:137 stop:496 length:360 start_codon:yes stop_codon:yes gene_type:complete